MTHCIVKEDPNPAKRPWIYSRLALPTPRHRLLDSERESLILRTTQGYVVPIRRSLIIRQRAAHRAIHSSLHIISSSVPVDPNTQAYTQPASILPGGSVAIYRMRLRC